MIEDRQRLLEAFHCLNSAVRDAQSARNIENPRRTDLIGVARQYSGRRIKREEFEWMLGLSIGQIIEMSQIPVGKYKPLGPRDNKV